MDLFNEPGNSSSPPTHHSIRLDGVVLRWGPVGPEDLSCVRAGTVLHAAGEAGATPAAEPEPESPCTAWVDMHVSSQVPIRPCGVVSLVSLEKMTIDMEKRRPSK